MRIAPWLLGSGFVSIWALTAFSCNTVEYGGSNLTVTFTAVTTSTGGGEGGASTDGTGGTGGSGGSGGSGGMGGMVGSGGMSAVGTGGAGGMAASSSSSSSGAGGAGGSEPGPVEKPLHGCLSAAAVDLTGAGPAVSLAFSAASKRYTATVNGQAIELAYPMCIRLKATQRLLLGGSGVKGDPLMVGGVVDGDGVGNYMKLSPLQPSCFSASTGFNANNVPGCYNGGVWPCGASGASSAAQCSVDGQKAFSAMTTYPFFDNSQKQTRLGALYIVP